MELDYTDEGVRNNLYAQLNKLMKEGQNHIWDKTPEAKDLYDSPTHFFLKKEGWEIMFPLKEENWPKSFQGMAGNYNQEFKWPWFTTYCYITDVIAPPLIPHSLLYFGYAVVEDKLIRCTFFVVQKMVEYQVMPQGMVIDPLANREGKVPSFYIGVPVLDKELILKWVRSRRNPLEVYVEELNAKERNERVYNSYMESYYLQMQHEPNWFPADLIKFAKEENLYIPPNQRSTMDT